jgi:5-methylthioadenosine/S-adenosylhomocysteine deaminase
MLLTADWVVVDPDTVLTDAAVVTEGEAIAFVGAQADAKSQYPDAERREYEVLLPGLVAAHVHSVQSLGRGIADDAPLLEWLFDAILPMEAAMDAEAVRAAAELGYLECLESGVTSVVDHPTVHHTEEVFEAARDLGIRARLGTVLMDRDAPAGLRQDADAALEQSAQLIERYHDAADGRLQYAVTPRFAVTCSEECLRGARDLADRHEGVRIHTHASETQDEVATIEQRTGERNVRWLDTVGLTGEDVLLAHGVWTDERERATLAETGTSVVHCPSANMKLASGVAPIADYRERGITVALGNDGPPCNNTLDPFTEMRQAALLGSVDALDPTVMPARDVFEMATLGGAVAGGFDRVGALREGWQADVVGLSGDRARSVPTHDPHSRLVYATHGDDVALTMVAGRICYADGTLATGDASAIREQAREQADRVTALVEADAPD